MAVKPGIYAASVSIFKEDMSLDILNTISHAEKLILKGGCHGTVLLGSTGMAQYISLKEKKKLIDKAGSSECKDNFVLGTGSNSLLENCEIIKHSLSNGINRFLLMPPAYFSYPDSGVYKYFANIIERVPEIFIILYNFEKLCGYKFSVQVIEKLVKDFPAQIVAVKDSSYNLINTLDLDILIFPGSELKLLEGLESGKCHGIISAVANISSKISRQIYEDHHKKGSFVFYENWENINAYEAYLEYREKQGVMEEIGSMLVSPPEIIYYNRGNYSPLMNKATTVRLRKKEPR